MNPQNISHLLIEYRYWILIPFAIIEGPIVAFISGTLASLGYFNIFILGGFFFLRDIVMDGLYYCLGYYGSKTKFAKWTLKKMKFHAGHLEELRAIWEKHPMRTMLIGKISYGVAQAFIMVAGMVKMSLRKFFSYGAFAALVQYGTLLCLGYFFGNAFGGKATAIVNNLQYVIAGAALILSAYYIFRWYIGHKFPPEE
jgi:membrane protein DedA with SNARE-associated domain